MPIILCVDDEHSILLTLRNQLSRQFPDCTIDIAGSAEEALQRVDERRSADMDIPLVIVDQIMPGMNGNEFLIELYTRYPQSLAILLIEPALLNPVDLGGLLTPDGTPLTFMSGFSDAEAIGNIVNRGNLYRLIPKPWNELDLALTVSEALRRYRQDQHIAQQQALLNSGMNLDEDAPRSGASSSKFIPKINNAQQQAALEQANQQLADLTAQQSEIWFQTLAKNMPGMMYRYFPGEDGVGCFTYVSPGSIELLDLEPDSILQNANLVWHLIHPDDFPSLQSSVAIAVQACADWQWEGRLTTPSGRLKWIQGKSRPQHTANGVVWDGLLVDISDRKQAEQALQQAKVSAEAANRAKSVFLANMSHELRTPLNVILGFAQIMKRDIPPTSKDQTYINLIYNGGQHLLQLINEILDLAKVEAGKFTVENKQSDLFAILHALPITFRQKASNKQLQLHLDITPGVPQYINADMQKIEQILINLVGNAIKFTERGTVTVRVSLPEAEPEMLSFSSPSSILLRFEVEDTGVGIAPEDLSLIFDAFTQGSAGQQSQEGTGLGLTISCRLAQLMGGDLTVRSVVGQGSTFEFTLPVEMVPEATFQSPQGDRTAIALEPNQPDYRILVVDDQAENRLLMVNLLEPLGLVVQEATTGEAAIELWQQWHPHLIWMDISLPESNGYEITQRIRTMEEQPQGLGNSPQLQHTIIIALTAHAMSNTRTLALAAGCDDYISKPFETELLFRKMAEHLGIRYVYTEASQVPNNNDSSMINPPLKVEDLAVMPQGWLIELYQAALSCDQKGVTHLLQQIPANYASLAYQLEQLTQDFDFPQIMNLAEPYFNRDILPTLND